MPDLTFAIIGVEPVTNSLSPMLRFKLRVTNTPATESIRAITLQTQIQLQPARRQYTPVEQEKLVELFGTPDRWGETLRNKLWAQAPCNVGAFTGSTEVVLSTPCTFDLNIMATKYFLALDEGDVSLLFLFNGSVFYSSEGKGLQVQQIPWDKECTFRMPVSTWRETMERLFSNGAWVNLQRDVFDAFLAYKRGHGFTTWDDAVQQLLCLAAKPEGRTHE